MPINNPKPKDIVFTILTSIVVNPHPEKLEPENCELSCSFLD